MAIKKIPGIYLIKSYITGAVYVGSTRCLLGRRNHHFYGLKHNKNGNRLLQEHYNQYGPKSLCWGILEYADISILLDREQYWLNRFENKFNLCPEAGISKGYKYTELQRQNHKAAKKPISEAHREKIRLMLIERNKSPKMRQLTIDRNKSRVWNNEEREKLRKARIGTKMSEETRQRHIERNRTRARNPDGTWQKSKAA